MQSVRWTGVLFLVLMWGAHCSSQTVEIMGVVTTFGKIPVQNAEVSAKKSGETVYTDSKGQFRLNCMDRDVLSIKASGFDNFRVRTRGKESLAVDIVYSNTEKSRTEAIKGRHITGTDLDYALENYPLKGEKDYSSYPDIFSLVNTEIIQLAVRGTSISPRIPNTMLGSNSVLLVVNGMPVDDISFVSPVNVKSIKYISGPDASSWGVRGSNGVLEITLKSFE